MSGHPPVVLVHGLATSSARTWGDNGWLDLLADAGRTALPLDLMGHGTAPRPTDPAAYDRFEDDLLERFPAEPVDAIGFSHGARTLLTIAIRSSLTKRSSGNHVHRSASAARRSEFPTPASVEQICSSQASGLSGTDPSRRRRPSGSMTSGNPEGVIGPRLLQRRNGELSVSPSVIQPFTVESYLRSGKNRA